MTTTTTPTDTDTAPTTTDPASEIAGGSSAPQRRTGVRIAVAVLAAAALAGGGYAVGAAVHSDAPKFSGKVAPYSQAFDQDSARAGYGQGAAVAASVGANAGPYVLSTAVPMGGRIVDALPADTRTPDNDRVAATALPAGHVLTGSDLVDPVRGGAVFTVSVRADQYPAVTALRYGQGVSVVGAGDTAHLGRLVGVQPTANGAAVVSVATGDGQRAVADVLAHADTIHIVGMG